MPFYDYNCDKCGATKEVRHAMSAEPTVECECGNHMKKGFSAIPAIYKCTGFYSVDNRIKERKNYDPKKDPSRG